MRILLLGHDHFRPHLIRAGVEVVWLGTGATCDLRADPERIDLSAAVARLALRPDFLLLTDDLGRRVVPHGLERLAIPKVHYGVDAPINYYWQRHLAGLFDLVCLDQKDSAERLGQETGRRIHWLPVSVEPSLYEVQAGESLAGFGTGPDVVFVGTREASVRPKRENILKRLEKHFHVETHGARGAGWLGPKAAARLFRRARLVLNENLFPGLTTRQLEVMAAGGCLFTEACGNGLTDLFQPGRDLIAFGPEDIVPLAQKYLADPAARRRIARSGREKFLAGHTTACRTQELLGLMDALERDRPRPEPDLSSLGWALLLLGTRWPAHDGPRRLARSEILFKQAIRQGREGDSARLGLGLTLLAQGRPEEAAEVLARPESENFRLHLALGLILQELGRSEQSRAALDRAAESLNDRTGRVAESPRPGSAGFHLFWGRLLDEAGDGLWPGFNRRRLHPAFWGGLEHFLEARTLAPDDPAVFTSLADLLDRHGQPAFSEPLWRRAGDLRPGDAFLAERQAQAARLGFLEA